MQEPIEVARDWLDYAVAGVVLVSLVLASAAVWFAKRSSDSASRSAQAAQDTVRASVRMVAAAERTATAATKEAEHSRELVSIAREQQEALVAEQSRRPALWVDLRHDSTLHIDRTIPVVFRAVFMNIGTSQADGARATFITPRGLNFFACAPGGVKPLGITPSPESSHQLTFAGEPNPSQFHEWRIDPFPPDHPELWHALVYFPHAGIYEIALALEHEDADAPAFQRFTVVVGNDGAVQISDTETN